MSSLHITGCCALVLLAVTACGPHSAVQPKNAGAEARNGETEKKPRKPLPRLVAPPPAYGNKIVLEGSTDIAAREGEEHIGG